MFARVQLAEEFGHLEQPTDEFYKRVLCHAANRPSRNRDTDFFYLKSLNFLMLLMYGI